MSISMEKGWKKIVFPLDFSRVDDAVGFARRLEGRVGLFKVGLELFVSAGPAILGDVRSRGEIFLDLKLHDIPATVEGAARAAASQGVRFLSVHAGGGARMLEAAVKGAGGETGILAITVLTSHSREELRSLGLAEELTDPSRLVLQRATLAKEAGCAGIVCSGKEVEAVKKKFGPDFLTLVPGIRPSWGSVPGDDQARVASPGEAVRRGADYLVIGRPIRLAPDPVETCGRIAAEIEDALS